MTISMTRTQKQMALRLRAKGLTITEIAHELNYTTDAIRVTVRGEQIRDGRPDDWSPAPGRLSAEEREEIMVGERRSEPAWVSWRLPNLVLSGRLGLI